MKPILLFDIDGTLLRVKKRFMNKMMSALLDELKIKKDVLNEMSFAGRTDKDIFGELVSRHGRQPDLFDTLKNRYLAHLQQTFTEGDADRIEGAVEAVQQAAHYGAYIGLCTGNFREAALLKVGSIGLGNAFSFGGFGCNHADRRQLPHDAHQEFSAFFGYKPEPQNYVVIGDTPNDIRCAAHFGAISVAVTTGSFSRGELEKHSPDYILDDLRRLQGVLKLQGFKITKKAGI